MCIRDRDKINTLLQTLNQTSGEQRAAIESLAASAATVMEQASRQFADTLGRSMERSDEQLAYYVAQAREVIDLSISSQQGVIEDLRRLHKQRPALVDEVAG